jgi:hypothetical protein
VPSTRLLRILTHLHAVSEQSGEIERLCEVSADIVEMSGAGILVMSNDHPSSSMCSSNAVSARIEELQFTTGEGPCVDAFRHSRPVLEPDLNKPVTLRWSAFGPPAVAAGARAVFGFPMSVGAVRMGALNLYRDAPGALTEDQHADALIMAEVGARALLAVQLPVSEGDLAADLGLGSNIRYVVHQASGMVAVQLHVSVGEALVRLRTRAFAEDRSVTDLAKDVVNRRIRFEADPDSVS